MNLVERWRQVRLRSEQISKKWRRGHWHGMPQKAALSRWRTLRAPVFVVNKVDASDPQPEGIPLKHYAPAPILGKDFLRLVAQLFEALAKPSRRLATVHTGIRLFVFTRFGFKKCTCKPAP